MSSPDVPSISLLYFHCSTTFNLSVSPVCHTCPKCLKPSSPFLTTRLTGSYRNSSLCCAYFFTSFRLDTHHLITVHHGTMFALTLMVSVNAPMCVKMKQCQNFTYRLQVVVCIEKVPNKAHYMQLLIDSLHLCQLRQSRKHRL